MSLFTVDEIHLVELIQQRSASLKVHFGKGPPHPIPVWFSLFKVEMGKITGV